MEKFLKNLAEAERIIQVTDHMVYVTYPLIKNKRLLLHILQQTKTAMGKYISSILQHEYLYKKIKLYEDTKANFRTFKEKCAPEFQITPQEIKIISELFDLAEKQQKSSMEFMREEKLVILSENLKPATLTLEKIKEFLTVVKKISKKVKERMIKI